MSLVTAQGIQARADFSRRTEQTRDELRAFLDNAGTAAVSAIIERFSNQPEKVVREAMWLLIDDREAEITADRRLRLTQN